MATINVTAGEIQNVVSPSGQPIQTIAVNIGNNTSALPAAVPVINTAIADDFASIAPTAQQSPLSAPDNFVFVDNMVGVGGTIPGDKFQGTTQGITSQFIFLTPDSIGVSSLTPNQFIKTDIGNDSFVLAGGRNIVDAGAGANLIIGKTTTETDTVIGDVRNNNVVTQFSNFHQGDDLVTLGLNTTDFGYVIKDTIADLEIDATPLPTVLNKFAAAVVIPGFMTTDVGAALTIGFAATPSGTQYMFVHGNPANPV